jgi:choline dehydrogenase
VKPRIDQGFLADREDLRLLADALQTAHLLVTDPVLASLVQPLYPDESLLSDRAALLEWLPFNCGSGYHPCGTVPMGPDGDPQAALDGRGRVRGVEGMIVADASIMPTCPSPNTNLTTLMIGERFGEWLRDGAI